MGENGTISPAASRRNGTVAGAAHTEGDIKVAPPISRDKARDGVRGAVRAMTAEAPAKPKKQRPTAPEPADDAADDFGDDDAPPPRTRQRAKPKAETREEAPAPKPRPKKRPEPEETDEADDADDQPRDHGGRFKPRAEEADDDSDESGDGADEGEEFEDDEDEQDEEDGAPEPEKGKRPSSLAEHLGFDPAELDSLRVPPQSSAAAQQPPNNQPGVTPAAHSSQQPQRGQQAPQTLPEDWGISDAQFDELETAYMPPEAAKGLRQLQQVLREQDQVLRQSMPVINWMAERMQVVQREQQRVFQETATSYLEELRGFGLTTFGKAGEQITQGHPAAARLQELERTAVYLWDKTGRLPEKARACLATAAAIVDREGMEKVLNRQATAKLRESAQRRQAGIDPLLGGRGTRGVAPNLTGRDAVRSEIRRGNFGKPRD